MRRAEQTSVVHPPCIFFSNDLMPHIFYIFNQGFCCRLIEVLTVSLWPLIPHLFNPTVLPPVVHVQIVVCILKGEVFYLHLVYSEFMT